MSIDIDLTEIAALFIEESTEGLDIMESGLLNLDLGAADPETMNGIFRAAHSIKGGGATFGFDTVSEFAHHVETLLDEMRQGSREVTSAAVDLLLESVDCLRSLINQAGRDDVDMTRARELETELTAMINNTTAESAAKADKAAPAEAQDVVGEPTGWYIEFKPHADMLRSANDPLRILNELRALAPDPSKIEVICAGTTDLRTGEFDTEACHLGWEIALDAPIPEADVREVFAWVEDECELSIEPMGTAEPVASMPSEESSAPTEAAEKAAPKTEPEPAPVAAKAPQKAAPQAEDKPKAKGKPKAAAGGDAGSIRVKIDKVDALINLVGELVITQSMLSRFNGEFDISMLQGLQEGLTQLARNTRELQESVMAIRMLPISFAFNRFPRLVRDTGNSLKKKVELRLTGENTELDKTVLEKIGDPLVHLVRNSLDHGLETPEARVAAGKPETGVLELKAYHEGGNIVIQVIDDGAGINRDRVLAKAVEQGLVAADEQLTDDRIANLIFMPGFSTAETVNDLSGRGVGMDVVRRNIADLGGTVSVKTTPGVGSTFTIVLPLTLAILDGQLVRVGEQSLIVPLVSIVETIQAPAERVNEIAGGPEIFRLRDEYLPVVRLHELFGIESSITDISEGLLVVAEANGHRVGLLVDDLAEQTQVVIKSLEVNYRQTAGISGATILGDGSVALILDVPGVLSLHQESSPRNFAEVA